MKNLWTYIEKKKWHADTKYRVALLILGTLFALAGWYALLGILLLSHGLLYYSILVIMIFMMANAADNGKGTWYIYRYLRRLQLRH